jgi:hypothetical protein
VYDDVDGGTVGGGGAISGLTMMDYGPETYASGELRFAASNNHFVDQTFILEHGAILLEQPDGAAMIVPPLLSFTQTSSQTVVEWTLPSLQAGRQTMSGPRAISIVADPVGTRLSLLAAAGQLAFDLPSNHPEVWQDFFLRALRDLGFNEGDEFTVSSDGDSCRLVLDGIVSALANDDLLLNFHQADIEIELALSG